MHRTFIALGLAGLAVTACQTTSSGSLITGGTAEAVNTLAPAGCDAAIGDIEIETNAICRGVDLIAGSGSGRPSSRLRYAETDQFDLDLNASMDNAIDPILLAVEGGAIPLADVASTARPGPNSKRIVFWLARIRDTGGENIACAPTAGDRDFGAALVNLTVNMAFDRLEAWRTYRPAQDYNAVLHVERDDTVGDLLVRRIEFHRRDSGRPLACPEPAASDTAADG